MKKITMLLLAALLLIGIASAASAFEYAPAEKLEIDGIEVNKVWVDMIPVYYTLPADYQEGQDMKICLFLSGLSGNKESLVSTYSDFITSRGYVGVFFDHYEHGERSINGTTILNSSEDEVAALKKKILDTNESVRTQYRTADNPVFEVFYLDHAVATIAAFTGLPPKKFFL